MLELRNLGAYKTFKIDAKYYNLEKFSHNMLSALRLGIAQQYVLMERFQ